ANFLREGWAFESLRLPPCRGSGFSSSRWPRSLELLRVRALDDLDEVVWSNPLRKRSLYMLRSELGVHICSHYRLVQGKAVRCTGDQTFRDAANTGFGQGNLLEKQDLRLFQRFLRHGGSLHLPQIT